MSLNTTSTEISPRLELRYHQYSRCVLMTKKILSTSSLVLQDPIQGLFDDLLPRRDTPSIHPARSFTRTAASILSAIASSWPRLFQMALLPGVSKCSGVSMPAAPPAPSWTVPQFS